MVRLDVAPLLSSIKFLVDLAKRKAQRWTETAEKRNQQMMLKACGTMAEATSKIDEGLETLRKDPFDVKAKDDVMWAARSIIQSTVALLQLSDNYDIRKTINACKASEEEQKKLLEGGMDTLQDSVRQLVYETVNLAKLVQDRINYIVDPMLQRKLDECNQVVRTQAEPLIHAHVACLQAPNDEDAKKKRDQIASDLSKAYKKIISLAKLSSQEMFSGIDLNLNPLDDDDKFKEIKPVEVTLEDGCRRIIEMAGNQVSAQQMLAAIRDAQNACEKEIERAKKAIAEETDPEKKKVLEAALANLESNMKHLKEMGDVYAKKATPANAKKISEIAAALMDAGAQMQEAIEMPDHLDRAANLVQVALAQLADAVKFKGEPEVLAAAKAVNAALQDQVNLAKKKVEKDPKRKRALQAAMSGQQGVLKGMLTGTKNLLDARDKPNAGPKWDAFNVGLDDVAAYSQKIADLSDPARAAQMFQTPEELIQNAIRKVNEDMEKLQKGGPDSAEALKAVANGLNALMGLAKQRKGKKANAMATAMAGTLGGMLKSGREYLKDPKNYGALDKDCSAIRDQESELLNDLVPIPARMIDLCGDLQDESQKLLRALDENDKREAPIRHENVQRHLKDSIDAIERTPADGEKRQWLDKLKKQQERIRDELEPAVQKSLDNPDDKAAYEKVEDLLEEARNNTLAIASAVSEDLEYAAIAGAAKANNAMRNLKQAANTADEEAADSARRNADGKLRRQAVIADLLALQTKDDKYKESLLEAGRDLSDILRELFGATGDALKGDDQKLKELSQDNRDANQAILDGITDPVGRMEALGVRINNHVDGLSYPVDDRQRMALVGVVDGLEQQTMLGGVVAKRDPEKAEELERGIKKANDVLEKLKPAIIDAIADPKDLHAQNHVEDLMREARQANIDLVEAAQSKDLFDRILSNVDASEREMKLLDDALRKGDRGTAQVIAEDLKARQQKQSQLLKKAAQTVGPKLGKEINELGLQVARIGANLANAAVERANNPKNVPAATNYNRGTNKMKGANTEIRNLIARAKKGEDEEEESSKAGKDDWSGGVGGLQNAANALRKRTRELKIDESAKGRMFAEAQKIADAMQRLAKAANENDKTAMINISKEIAQYTQNVVSISKTIPAQPSDKEQIVSYALSAKGTSVQLKIMAAVKASIHGKDRTAEDQLVTCASTLAEQVSQAVQTALSAELRIQ